MARTLEFRRSSRSRGPHVWKDRPKAEVIVDYPSLQNHITNTETLSKEEARELVRRAQAGDQAALETLILRNLKMVTAIISHSACPRACKPDAFQFAITVIVKAVHKFDLNRTYEAKDKSKRDSYCFSSYLGGALKNEIPKFGRSDRVISIPPHALRDAGRAKRGLPPICTSPRDLKRALAALDVQRIDGPSMDGENTHDEWVSGQALRSLADWSDSSEGLTEQLERDELRATVLQVIREELNEREQAIIWFRFGLDGGEPETLKAVGQRIGLTRERVRQIEKIAKEKLTQAFEERGIT